ncbi:outer membrane beta-barrel protein [bacterium]|nr:outer membrane beta-barrel protein [bacterium]
MKKNILFISLLLLSQLHAQEKPNIAILELEGSGISKQDLQGLTNRLQTEFFKTEQFTVLERSKINEILEEQQFQMTGCTDLACAIEIGRLLNVELIVIGNVDRVGSIYSVNVRLVDVVTGEIIKNEIEDCPQCSLDEVFLKTLKNTAHKIAGLEVEPPPAPAPPVYRETPSEQPPPPPSEPVFDQEPGQKTKPKSGFKMGYYIGFGSSGSIEHNYASYHIEHKNSFSVSMTYDIPLSGRILFKPEIEYSARSTEITHPWYNSQKYTDLIHYIHIPVLMAFIPTKGLYAFAGPSFGFWMGGSWEAGSDSGEYDKEDYNSRLNRMIYGVELRYGAFCLGYRYIQDLNEEDKMGMDIKRTISYYTIGFIFSR